jgi:hypothetical protein
MFSRHNSIISNVHFAVKRRKIVKTVDRVKKIYKKLKILEVEMSSPKSEYYCTAGARKIKEAAELLKEFLEDNV